MVKLIYFFKQVDEVLRFSHIGGPGVINFYYIILHLSDLR
jgi:hypothetical protein